MSVLKIDGYRMFKRAEGGRERERERDSCTCDRQSSNSACVSEGWNVEN